MREIPAFWKTDLKTIDMLAKSVRIAKAERIAVTPGHRPIYAFAYGERRVSPSAANYNSACGARDRRFYDDPTDKNHCVLLIGAVHGHETEGTAALVNLITLLETGRDLCGVERPALAAAAAKIRLVIVPVANADGRARVAPASMVGLDGKALRHWGQGNWMDGSLCGWPGCKQRHPMKEVSFLGGYFNDDGVNLMHDQFFHPMAQETQALLDLAEAEHANCILQLHGGSNSVNELLPPHYVTREAAEATRTLAAACDAAAKQEGLTFGIPHIPEREHGETPVSFNLCSALHHVCGGVSAVFECNEAICDEPGVHMTHEEIYRSHLILFEQCFLQFARRA